MKIPFNKPFVIGHELDYIQEAVQGGRLAGDGTFTRKCQNWLQERYGGEAVLLTTSCTAALEMAAILLDIGPGDEVIMPSYTFVSTANAFAIRGARPRFVDIRMDTLNMNEHLVEKEINEQTKAIVPVHYGGVACEMNPLLEIAEKHKLSIVEDAAQGIDSFYENKALGTLGQLGCFSFHETKNFISGEGGALIVNDSSLVERAEIIWEKGTNRKQFFRGQVDKYTWQDIGSSYLPSELIAAYLMAQFDCADRITQQRRSICATYERAFRPLANEGAVKIPECPKHCTPNGHLFYLMLDSEEQRDTFIRFMKKKGVSTVFHYIPLHDSPVGRSLGYKKGDFPITEKVSGCLVRLPVYFELTEAEQNYVIEMTLQFFDQRT